MVENIYRRSLCFTYPQSLSFGGHIPSPDGINCGIFLSVLPLCRTQYALGTSAWYGALLSSSKEIWGYYHFESKFWNNFVKLVAHSVTCHPVQKLFRGFVNFHASLPSWTCLGSLEIFSPGYGVVVFRAPVAPKNLPFKGRQKGVPQILTNLVLLE